MSSHTVEPPWGRPAEGNESSDWRSFIPKLISTSSFVDNKLNDSGFSDHLLPLPPEITAERSSGFPIYSKGDGEPDPCTISANSATIVHAFDHFQWCIFLVACILFAHQQLIRLWYEYGHIPHVLDCRENMTPLPGCLQIRSSTFPCAVDWRFSLSPKFGLGKYWGAEQG